MEQFPLSPQYDNELKTKDGAEWYQVNMGLQQDEEPGTDMITFNDA